jgi:DNA replication protein DnaC
MRRKTTKNKPATHQTELQRMLLELGLPFMLEHHQEFADMAAKDGLAHAGYLEKLAEGEAALRQDRTIQRRITQARFPVIKTIEQFQWSWPKKIDRLNIQNLLRLAFIEDKANVILLGSVGIGKTHLATALGYSACLKGLNVLFVTAIDAINGLAAAHAAGRLGQELKKYRNPDLLILDELGYLPLDKHGADLLFQVISNRYERGSIIITSNRAFRQWPEIFNNDSTLTSAILDRVLHHANTVCIEGKSYRMKDQVET